MRLWDRGGVEETVGGSTRGYVQVGEWSRGPVGEEVCIRRHLIVPGHVRNVRTVSRHVHGQVSVHEGVDL